MSKTPLTEHYFELRGQHAPQKVLDGRSHQFCYLWLKTATRNPRKRSAWRALAVSVSQRGVTRKGQTGRVT